MKKSLLIVIVLLSLYGLVYAKDSRMDINDVTAMTMIKFSQFDARLKARAGLVEIFVLNDDKIAQSLNRIKSKLPETLNYQVSSGDTLPQSPPDILFIGDGVTQQILQYTIKNRVLSITNSKQVFKQGASVGIWENDRKIGVNLNTTQSINEGANWQFDYSKIGNLMIEFRGGL